MKLINKLTSAMMVLPILAGLTACSEEHAEYTPAKSLANCQVYFSTDQTNISTYTLTKEDGDGNTFEVKLNRVKTDEALTVNLVLTQDSTLEVFQIPASVTFDEGVNEVAFNVNYDPTILEYEQSVTASISFADGDEYSTPYGTSTYEFTASIPAPWESLGQATFVENIMGVMYGGNTVTYQVEIEENKTQPGYYRLVNPYGAAYPYNKEGYYDDTQDYYLYIHAEDPDFVYIPFQYLGVNWGDGELGILDFAAYYMSRGNSAEDVKAAGYGGTLVDGVISFPTKGLLVAFGSDGYYYGNNSGEFKIILPGYSYSVTDYSVSVNYLGIFTDTDGNVSAVGNVEAGDDVAALKACVISNSYSASTVAEALATGELSGSDVENGRIEIPFEGTGELMLVVAALDEDGNLADYDKADFEYYGSGSTPWNSLGIGVWTDAFVLPLYKMEPIQYEVEIQESNETPGVYRAIAPYGDAFPYSSAATAYSNSANITVNCEDPEGVYIPYQSIGLDMGYGVMDICSYGYYYYTKDYTWEEIKAAGLCGTLKDGIVSFEPGTLLSFDDDGGYECNKSYTFEMILPSAYANMVKAGKAPKTVKKATRRLSTSSKHTTNKVRNITKKVKITKKVQKGQKAHLKASL